MTGRGRWKRPPVEVRFWAKVQKSEGDGCWFWTGGLVHGYGNFWINGRNRRAHQVAFELTYGRPFEPGEVGRHSCDTPRCVRPDHVSPGTQAQNVADRDARGHTACGENQGHSKLTAEQVAEIRTRYKPYSVTRRALAADYGVSVSSIDAILDGETWKTKEPAA